MALTDPYEVAARYGVQFDGELVSAGYHDTVDYSEILSLREVQDRGGRISRVRMLADRYARRYDISYIHATLPDGSIHPVNVTMENCMPTGTRKRDFIRWAQSEGVYAKGIGLIDEGNWSTLWG